MTKEELEKEAKDYANKKVPKTEMPNMWNRFFKSYLAGAEPREKRIADLEDKLANADYQLEGRDNEIKELNEKIEKIRLTLCEYSCLDEKTKHYIEVVIKEIKEND